MRAIVTTVLAYLAFNLSVVMALGMGGAYALAWANFLGAAITGWYFRHQITAQGTKPKWLVAMLGSGGILAIVMGLRMAHANMPVPLSMEAVYNGFAVSSWPLFVLLHLAWPKQFTERPNGFDLACHLVMTGLVIFRFMVETENVLTYPGGVGVGVAIFGYALFNVSIKLAAGHRATNMAMNIGGGLLLLGYGLYNSEYVPWGNPWSVLMSSLVGGLSIFAIVRYLGQAYGEFGSRNLASLVAPLVYDSVLVATAFISLIFTAVHNGYLALPVLVVGIGMLCMTYIRYHHHTSLRAAQQG